MPTIAVRVCLVGLILGAVSCAADPAAMRAPTSSDAGLAEDAGIAVEDAGTEPDAGEWIDAGPQPLEGEAPFSRVLAGDMDLYGADGGYRGTKSLAVQAYFPEGMHAQAPYLLSVLVPDSEWPLVSYPAQGTLDERLGADSIKTVFSRSSYDWFEDAVLDSSAGSLTGQYLLCLGCGGDLHLDWWRGTAVLRNYGQETPRGRTASTVTPVPISRLSLVSSVPLSEASQIQLNVLAGGRLIEGDVHISLTGLSWSPTTSQVLPPNEPVFVSGTGLKDVVGRDVPVNVRIEQRRTTAVVTDLSLQTVSPSGALVEFSVTYDQRLELSNDTWLSEYRSGMVSLGRSSGATRLRLRLTQHCRDRALARAALVASDGASIPVPISCDEASLPIAVPLPGTGPVWLVVDDVPPAPVDLSVYVDSLSFE